jgi:hypothetical protein
MMSAVVGCRRFAQIGWNPSLRKYLSNWKLEDYSKFQEEDRVWAKSKEGLDALKSLLTTIPKVPISARDMNDFINQRLNTPSASPPQLRFISSLLTYPLTVAHTLRTLYPPEHDRPSKLQIAIIGARAEASLPLSWWKQCLYLDPVCEHLTIRFLGPHLPNRTTNKTTIPLHIQNGTKSQTLQGQETSWQNERTQQQYTLQLINDPLDACTFHDHPNAFEILLHSNFFLLFHPGMGSATLSSSWTPTLQLLFESRKPIAFTAFHPHDLSRDLQQLKTISIDSFYDRNDETSDDLDDILHDDGDRFEMMIKPHQNPFAAQSLRLDTDEPVVPNAKDNQQTKDIEPPRILQTNHSLYVILPK